MKVFFKKSKAEFQNLLDIFLLGHLKDYVYTEKPQTIEELTDVIIRHIRRINIDSDLCRRVFDNLRTELLHDEKETAVTWKIYYINFLMSFFEYGIYLCIYVSF